MKNIIIIIFLIILILFVVFGVDQIKYYWYFVQPFNGIFLDPVSLKKRKIAIITAEDRDDEYIKYHDISFQKYCDSHNYEYIRTTNCPKEEATTYWCKIHRVKKALDSGKYDYVMWADSDTIIIDKDTSLDSYISSIGEPDIIVAKYKHNLVTTHNVSAGVFLIKNSKIGKSFIDDCLSKINDNPQCIKDNKEQGLWVGTCYEEGVMNLLIRDKYYKSTYVEKNDRIVNLLYDDDKKDFNKTIVLHLAGWGNESRANIFKKYLS